MYELSGSIVPLVTPMTHEGEIDYDAVSRLLSWHQDASTSALVIGGSTGEGTLLTEKDREALLSFVIDQSSLPIWAGVSDINTSRVKDAILQAQSLGVDGVMISSPMYVKPSQTGIINYFSHIADQTDTSILLYNVPSRTGSTIDPSSACILSHHDNIVGIKECDISEERMLEYKEANAHFEVYCGDDQQMIRALSLGAAGVISVVGNLLPQVVALLYELVQSGQHAKAEAIESKWHPMIEILGQLSNPVAIKYLMSKYDYINPYMRSPLTPLSFQEEERLGEITGDLESLFALNES